MEHGRLDGGQKRVEKAGFDLREIQKEFENALWPPLRAFIMRQGIPGASFVDDLENFLRPRLDDMAYNKAQELHDVQKVIQGPEPWHAFQRDIKAIMEPVLKRRAAEYLLDGQYEHIRVVLENHDRFGITCDATLAELLIKKGKAAELKKYLEEYGTDSFISLPAELA